MTLLSSSSFFFSTYFQKRITQNLANQSMIDFAFTQKDPLVYPLIVKNEEVGSDKWLVSAAQLSITDADIANVLGDYFNRLGKQALAVKYWHQAALMHNNEAIFSLAQYYYQQAKFNQANDFIIQLNSLTNKALLLKVNIALAVGDKQALPLLLAKMSRNSTNQALINELASYGVSDGAARNFSVNYHLTHSLSSSCPFSITLIAGHLDDLRRWKSMANEYQQHSLAQYVCIDSVKYFPVLSMRCQQSQDIAIQCKEDFWENFSNNITTEYIAVMLPEGGANVHYGILYVDRLDTVDIFSHEISHLLGFVDEYALNETHLLCQTPSLNRSHNIALIDEASIFNSNKISIELVQQLPWASLIPKETLIGLNHIELNNAITVDGVGVFTAETCMASQKILAVKPIKERTALRNYNLAFPQQYLRLLSDNHERYSMPSFHYNIALALFLNGNIPKARYWLAQSAAYFSLPTTKEKILTGSF